MPPYITGKGEILLEGRRRRGDTPGGSFSFLATWLKGLAAVAALAFVLNPTPESFNVFLSHRSSWTFSSLRRSTYQRELLWSVASSGGERFLGVFGMFVPLPTFKSPASLSAAASSLSALEARARAAAGSLDDVQVLVVLYVLVFTLRALRLISGGAMRKHFAVSRPNLRAGRLHTLVTAALSHTDVVHMGMNLSTLLVIGSEVSTRLSGAGRRHQFWSLYIFSALGGSVASLAMHPGHYESMGASGALFGQYGYLAAVAAEQRVLWFGFDLTVVQALLANLAVGHLTTSLAPGATDNAMHLGGAVAGALFPRLLKFL